MSRSSSRLPFYQAAWGLAAATLCLASQGYAAEAEPFQLLTRMSQAAHTLNYEGTFVYAHGNQMQSVRIVHGVDEHGEYERLVSLSGKNREVIRNNDEVTCILPGDKPLQVERGGARRALPLIFNPDVALISDHYQLEHRGSERIAEREADHVAVLPKDRYRYGHGYWVDQATGLLLRADLVGEKGHIIEQMMFTSLTLLDSVPRKDLEGAGTHRERAPQRPDDAQTAGTAAKLEEGQWEAASLPPGFRLELLRHHPLAGKTVTVEHHVYSDGLASVSVFIGPADEHDKGPVGHSLRGAVHAYGRVADGSQIVVVGEVPAITVEAIASAMRPRTEAKP